MLHVCSLHEAVCSAKSRYQLAIELSDFMPIQSSGEDLSHSIGGRPILFGDPAVRLKINIEEKGMRLGF